MPSPLSEPVGLSSMIQSYVCNYLTHCGQEFSVCDLHKLIMSEVEHAIILEVLKHTKYNLSHASTLLGINRTTLRKKMNEYDIKNDSRTSVLSDLNGESSSSQTLT